MTKTITLHNVLRNTRLLGGLVFALLVVSLLGSQNAYAAITTQLDLGDSGSEVTELQTYLSLDPSIYPSGLVTGYYGQLTKAGIERFQTEQGIVSSGTPATTGYGRVGPQTMLRINTLMGSGGQPSGDATPIMSTPVVQYTSTSVTFTWVTNEPTQGQVFWSNNQLTFAEATGPRQQPYVSGTLALDSGGLKTSHSVTVSNLSPNTTYHYLVRSVDNVGNMSMVWPSHFLTSN
ncbi:hypothetical protein EPO56_00915 [Patescibacteria group bacterium]|nr:MAG: hypothetical protein EPO56_00915 [Patescibacteria group bacterium]